MSNNDKAIPKVRHMSKKTKLIIAIAVFVLLVGGATAIWWKLSSDNASRVAIIETKAKNTLVNAEKISRSGSTSEIEAAYEAAINSAVEPSQKFDVYMSQATLYINQKKYDEALKVVQKAKLIENSSYTASTLAYIYDLKSDKDNTIKYYQEAIDLIDPNSPMADADAANYRSFIKILNAND